MSVDFYRDEKGYKNEFALFYDNEIIRMMAYKIKAIPTELNSLMSEPVYMTVFSCESYVEITSMLWLWDADNKYWHYELVDYKPVEVKNPFDAN